MSKSRCLYFVEETTQPNPKEKEGNFQEELPEKPMRDLENSQNEAWQPWGDCVLDSFNGNPLLVLEGDSKALKPEKESIVKLSKKKENDSFNEEMLRQISKEKFGMTTSSDMSFSNLWSQKSSAEKTGDSSKQAQKVAAISDWKTLNEGSMKQPTPKSSKPEPSKGSSTETPKENSSETPKGNQYLSKKGFQEKFGENKESEGTRSKKVALNGGFFSGLKEKAREALRLESQSLKPTDQLPTKSHKSTDQSTKASLASLNLPHLHQIEKEINRTSSSLKKTPPTTSKNPPVIFELLSDEDDSSPKENTLGKIQHCQTNQNPKTPLSQVENTEKQGKSGLQPFFKEKSTSNPMQEPEIPLKPISDQPENQEKLFGMSITENEASLLEEQNENPQDKLYAKDPLGIFGRNNKQKELGRIFSQGLEIFCEIRNGFCFEQVSFLELVQKHPDLLPDFERRMAKFWYHQEQATKLLIQD